MKTVTDDKVKSLRLQAHTYIYIHAHIHTHIQTDCNADPVAVTSSEGLCYAGSCVADEEASHFYLEINN